MNGCETGLDLMRLDGTHGMFDDLVAPSHDTDQKTRSLLHAGARAFWDVQKNQLMVSQIHLRAYKLISEDNTGATIVVEHHRGQC